MPLVLIVPNLGGLGIHGVWLACAITDGLLALIAVALMVRTCRGMGKGRARTAAIEEGKPRGVRAGGQGRAAGARPGPVRVSA